MDFKWDGGLETVDIVKTDADTGIFFLTQDIPKVFKLGKVHWERTRSLLPSSGACKGTDLVRRLLSLLGPNRWVWCSVMDGGGWLARDLGLVTIVIYLCGWKWERSLDAIY